MTRHAALIVALIILCVGGNASLAADELERARLTVSKATDLIGKKVQNRDGKELGEVKDLVMDWRAGILEYAVLSFGGFLGIGDKYFAVPWEALSLAPDKAHFVLDVAEEKLKKAPGFDKKHWPTDMTSREWAQSVYDFYGVPPHWTSKKD